jgi:hypothetical protein
VLLHGRALRQGLTAPLLSWRAVVSCQHQMHLALWVTQQLWMQLLVLVQVQVAARQLRQGQQQARWMWTNPHRMQRQQAVSKSTTQQQQQWLLRRL